MFNSVSVKFRVILFYKNANQTITESHFILFVTGPACRQQTCSSGQCGH